jgi:hypothetical protein
VDNKTLYTQTNENWRFLARWRQLAFAGFLGVIAGTLAFFKSSTELLYSKYVVSCVLIFVALLGIIFWLADRRTHRLTMHACFSGQKLEKKKPGFFTINSIMDENDKIKHDQKRGLRMCGHSWAALLLFIGTSIIFSIGGVFILIWGLPISIEKRKKCEHYYNWVLENSKCKINIQMIPNTKQNWQLIEVVSDSVGSYRIIFRNQQK